MRERVATPEKSKRAPALGVGQQLRLELLASLAYPPPIGMKDETEMACEARRPT